LWSFALLDFPAGKFPLKCHGLVGPSLANQNASVANQKSGDDEAQCGPGRARVGDRLRFFHNPSVYGR